MFMHVTMNLKYGALPRLFETMPKVKAIVEKAGWELCDALYFVNGRINSAVHIWKLRDMNHYMEGVERLSTHPDFPSLSASLAEIFDNEVIVFAQHAPYSPKAVAAR
jgi:hypothetical protein